MTSLLDRPITATIKYEIIEIKFDLHHNLPQQVKNVLKFGLLFFFKFQTLQTRSCVQQERRQLGSYWPELAILAFLRPLRSLRF